MNILVISYEAWRNTNNGGNVLSNIFCAFDDVDIAQIYCSGDMPQNNICRKYYQISESLLLTSAKGRRLEEKDYSADDADQTAVIENKINSKIPGVIKNASQLARELMWTVFNWKTKELDAFIREFKPDLIFAPCYYYYHVSKVALYAESIADCPVISYISDDNYSLKNICFYPSFWINRLITRKWIRKLFSASSLIYTMTELQKTEYEQYFGRPMKILCKSAEFNKEPKKEAGNPLRLIYAGGLYLNRWKMLAALSDALAEINGQQIKAQLHIYSGTELAPRIVQKINDGKNAFFHGQISYQELHDRYRESDIAVFVESFDLKNRLTTRLSFSTKIIDCLNSGCAVLAIGPEDQGGMSYLKKNDAAICVNDLRELSPTVREIADHPGLITEYANKALRLGQKNHMKDDIEKTIRKDFYDIAAGKPPTADY